MELTQFIIYQKIPLDLKIPFTVYQKNLKYDFFWL